MNDDVKRWQDDGRRAFGWIDRMYSQSKTAWDDAQASFEEAGWTYQFGNGFGGAAYSTNLDEWPFVYLKAFFALPPGIDANAASATAGIFGFLFFDGKRDGPVCFAGSMRWSLADAQCDHWLLYTALAGAESDGLFARKAGPVRSAIGQVPNFV